ncbi:MAG: F0F1 ATP synthase subunit epsilon [Rhodobacteraceae bacterium]|nr:F0F1 ATP synthase subunit epsilon [Paracoccaceae bacterium]
MAATLQFDLVSPERRLASVAVTEVMIPGADGDMTAMAGHAATVTTLRPGILTAQGADGAKSYVVTGGFAEITGAGVSVLAERAVPLAEATPALFDSLIADAREAAAGQDRDAADKIVADLLALKSQVAH